MGQANGAVGLLADGIGAPDEVYAEVGDQRHVGQCQEEAAAKFHPRLVAIAQVLGEAVDARMGIDRVAVTHPQREDRRVEVPFQLLQLGEG